MEWYELAGINEAGATPAPATAQPNFAEVLPTTQAPNIVAEARRPAANPVELESRVQGWMQVAQKLMSDPNIQQGLFVAGAGMMQPVQPGDTAAGVMGRSALMGASAFNQAKATDFAKQQALAKQKREEESHRLAVERDPLERAALQARTRGTEASAAATEIENRIKNLTADQVIAKSRLSLRSLELAQDQAEKDAALREITRDNEAIRAYAQRPDIPAQEKAKLDKTLAEIETTRATGKYQSAHARQAEAKAGLDEATLTALKAMPEKEFQQALISKFKGHQAESALNQHAEMYGKFYDLLPDDSPAKKGKTRVQFQMEEIRRGQEKDAIEQFIKAKDKLTDEEIAALGLRERAEAVIQSRGGRAGGPIVVKTIEDYKKLPKGARYIDPNGIEKTKK